MKVIISYQEKAKLTLSEKIQENKPKDISITQETSKHLGVLCQTAGLMYISYYLIPTHKNEYKPLYIHCKYTRIFKKLTTFWKNMNSQDQYLKQL